MGVSRLILGTFILFLFSAARPFLLLDVIVYKGNLLGKTKNLYNDWYWYCVRSRHGERGVGGAYCLFCISELVGTFIGTLELFLSAVEQLS